jgi:hypothetical protein
VSVTWGTSPNGEDNRKLGEESAVERNKKLILN